MRVVLALLLLLGPLAPSAFAQAFRVATWQVDDLPPAGTPTNTPAVDPERLNEIAAILSSAEADAIILYGPTDGALLKKIGELMKPRKYTVAMQAAFRVSGTKGPLAGQPFAILSPHQRTHAKTVNWAAWPSAPLLR